jgi:Domain of unknown function (DUF4290)
MNKLDMGYNTERPDIRYPEYGRAIQEMIEYATTIEEPYKRQKTVESIIGLMQQLNPNSANRNVDDYREKLWNHAFAISHYKLDVTPPNGVVIRREEDKKMPPPMPYPMLASRFRHYGNNVQTLMQKAIEMPDGPKKEGFVEVIASYMKLAYKTWNREHYVSDDVVKDDLEMLSDGQLELHEGHSSLDLLAIGASKKDREMQRNSSNQRNKNKNGKNSGGGSNGGKKNKYGNFRRRK